ncbi:hypothetical protein SDC9_108788 [bioreactor metagenome]|uniref:Uncharacterized protein n=1 Tax=bioreactor metagenome TaxID=1076179 RepID=A0A645BJK3_9ZZZZ
MHTDESFRKDAVADFQHKGSLVISKGRQWITDVAGPQLFFERFSDMDIGILDKTVRVFLGDRNAGNQAEDCLFICRNTFEIPSFKIGTFLFQVALKQDRMGHFICHGAALPFACILIFTMQQHPLFRQFFTFAVQSFFGFIRSFKRCLFMHVNSDESSLIGVQHRARQLTSDERLLAGGDRLFGFPPPAKQHRSHQSAQ